MQVFDQHDKESEINVAVYSEYAAEIKIATPEEVRKVNQFCRWNPPELQEQYKADQQAKKQSKDAGLTSKEADKLAALDRFKNMGGNGQADKEDVVPPKNNQDNQENVVSPKKNQGDSNKNGQGNSSGNQGNQHEWKLIGENQTIVSLGVDLLGQQQMLKKIQRTYSNGHGVVVKNEITMVFVKQQGKQNIGWSNKYMPPLL